ncbi:MAG: class I SAM-dependent methyltransferase [Bacteroidales bacterium]|nr:class I SAM-dependent methyltransferase [Bacteroidales bacterium]
MHNKRKNKAFEDNPRSIKYYVKKYLLDNSDKFKNKKIIDFPAGNGITSKLIKKIGAIPVAMDLFPEYFELEVVNCIRANVMKGLPLDDEFGDALICQEGIEHFSDQFYALIEFNRVLKMNASLLITTPNYSNLRSKLSYFLSESERYNSIMPPNELDSIWMNNQEVNSDIYFGHIFLIGIQKLRVLAKLAGFKIKKVYPSMLNTNSLVLFPFFYPFIFLSNWISYRKNLKKNKDYNLAIKSKVYKEIFRLAINPRILISGSLMVEFEKEEDYKNVSKSLRSKHKNFGLT